MHNQLCGVAYNSLIDFDCPGKIHDSVFLARSKQASSLDRSIKGTPIDALESGRVNTKILIACLGGAHAEGRLWREADEAHRADKPSLISAQRRLFIWRNERAREAIGFATISPVLETALA